MTPKQICDTIEKINLRYLYTPETQVGSALCNDDGYQTDVIQCFWFTFIGVDIFYKIAAKTGESFGLRKSKSTAITEWFNILPNYSVWTLSLQ